MAVAVEILGAAPVPFDSLAAWRLPHLRAQRRDRRFLVSVDDDWWQPRDWVRAGWAPGWEAPLAELAANLRGADGIVVPSPRLAERMRHFGCPITVIPPALPLLAALPAPRPARAAGGLRIGWAGTAWHWADLNFIGPAVLGVEACGNTRAAEAAYLEMDPAGLEPLRRLLAAEIMDRRVGGHDVPGRKRS